MNIGMAVRSKRLQKNLSVRELASITGLSPGTISKIENERTVPSVITISNIASSMGIHVGEFFIEDKDDFVEVVKKENRKVIGDKSCKGDIYRESLFDNENINMRPEIITLTPKSIYKGSMTSKGEEFIYVLSGKVICTLEGTEKMELEEGDSMYYYCSMPYKWKNILDNEEAKIMVVTSTLVF